MVSTGSTCTCVGKTGRPHVPGRGLPSPARIQKSATASLLLLTLRVSQLNMGKEEPVLRFVGTHILALVMISPHQICQISWVFKHPQGSLLCPLKLDRVSIYRHSEPSQSTLEVLHLAISVSFSSWLWDFKGTFLVLGIFLKRSSCLIWAPLLSSRPWTTKVTCNRNRHWWNRGGKLFYMLNISPNCIAS